MPRITKLNSKMISPVALSLLFLILTFLIVLGWTRVIFGSGTEEEELLKSLRRQISNIATLSKENTKKGSDEINSASSSPQSNDENGNMEQKSEKQNCKNDISKLSPNNTSRCSSFSGTERLDDKSDSYKIEQKFSSYIKEIDKMMKEQSKKEQTPIKSINSRSSQSKFPDIRSNSYITVKVKKSPTFVNYLALQSEKQKNKSRSPDKKNGNITDSSFLSCPSGSDLALNKHRSRSPVKKEYITDESGKLCSENSKDQKRNIGHKCSKKKICSSSSSSSVKSETKSEILHHAEPLRRYKSLNNKLNHAGVTIRKSSSDETFFKNSSIYDKHQLKAKRKLSFTIQNDEDCDNGNFASIYYSNHEPVHAPDKKKELKRRKGSPYRNRRMKKGSNPELTISDDEYIVDLPGESVLTSPRDKSKARKATKIPTSKWKDGKKKSSPVREVLKLQEIPFQQKLMQKQDYCISYTSDLGLDQSSSVCQNDYKKLSDEFQYHCQKSLEQNVGPNLLATKMKFPLEEHHKNNVSDGCHHRRPSSPKKYYCNAHTLNNILSNLNGRNCQSDCTNEKALSPVKRPRSRSYERIKSTMRDVQDENLCLNGNVYDIGLIRMDTPDEMLTEFLYGSEVMPVDDNTKKNDKQKDIEKPLTCDKSTEVKRSLSHDELNRKLESRSVNTSNICFADGTQTSFPKLAVQHIEGFCEPIEITEKKSSTQKDINSTNTKVKEEENKDKSKPTNLVMPNVNLVDVSNSLKKSRHLIEELVKETKNLVSDQDKHQKKQNEFQKSKIPSPKKPISPRQSPRPTPKQTPCITPIDSPRRTPKLSPKTSTDKFSNHVDNIKNADLSDTLTAPSANVSHKRMDNLETEIVEKVQVAPVNITKQIEITNTSLAHSPIENIRFQQDLCRSLSPNKNTYDTKPNNTFRNPIYSDTARPISPGNKNNTGRSVTPNHNNSADHNGNNNVQNFMFSDVTKPKSPVNKHRLTNANCYYSEISPPKSPNKKIRNFGRNHNLVQNDASKTQHISRYSKDIDSPNPGTQISVSPRSDSVIPVSPNPTLPNANTVQNEINFSKTNYSRNANYSEMGRPISPSYAKQAPRKPSPITRMSRFTPFCSEKIRPISPNNMKKNNEKKGSTKEFTDTTKSPNIRNTLCSEIARPISPNIKHRGNRNRSISPCIPVRTSHRWRSPGKVYARPPSPRLSILQEEISQPPPNYAQMNLPNEIKIQRSTSKSPPRHDMACSTMNFNANMSNQCGQSALEPTNKTRWTINPELKKYQSYDYSLPREKWIPTIPTNSMPTSNFYQVTDFCKQTPYLNRSLSPLPNPGTMKTENLRRILHAKEIATRINR